MATTKIWPIRDNLKRVVSYAANPEKTEFGDLQQALHYATADSKTSVGKEMACFVSGVNCRAETAYDEMRTVKERFGKNSGNVAYHCYQSFKPGEVTPELCHEIGVKLARQLWGKRFQVLVATHLDRGHLHNHLVLNSVSFVDGKKFNDNYRAYYRMRELSDKLCHMYGLSVIENPKGKTPRSLYFVEKNGEPTKYNLMREAIDTALKISSSRQDFKRALRDMGYILNDDPNRKYATLCRTGDKKAVRLFRLGEAYNLPAFGERLRKNYYQSGSRLYERTIWQAASYTPPKQYRLMGSLSHSKKIGGFRGLYLHYCYLLGVLPKRKDAPRPMSPQMREAVRRLAEISREARLICRKKLDTTGDVREFISRETASMQMLCRERQKLYNRLRRCDDPATIAEIKTARDALTTQIVALRKDIKTATNVLARSGAMREDVRMERNMRAETLQRDRMIATRTKKHERSYAR